MATPLASFENPRFHTKHGFQLQKQGHPEGEKNILPQKAAIEALLDTPSGTSVGHSQPDQKKVEPLSQEDILIARAAKDQEIISSKANQEVQQTSGSLTFS
jgi:hypothetical protein